MAKLSYMQKDEEFIPFISFCRNHFKDKDLKILVEIGVATGGSMERFSEMLMPPNSVIVGIDNDQLDSYSFRGNESYLLSLPQKITLLHRDSHAADTPEALYRTIGGTDRVSLLFIDGDHTYEGVKKDYEMYSPFVESEGLIAFHDIVEMAPGTGCQVSKFWHELKQTHPDAVEFIYKTQLAWGGIGILIK